MKLTNILPAIMGLKSISPRALHLIKDNPVTIFDVNSPKIWMKHHVPEARNLDPDNFNEKELPQNKTSLLIFYCSNPMCQNALKAANRAKGMGFKNVKVMPAGIKGWISDNLPVKSEQNI